MYAKLFQPFENATHLNGKAWQHALNLDLIENSNIQDCSLHCFHYQKMFEMLFKFLLETKSQFGAYSHT